MNKTLALLLLFTTATASAFRAPDGAENVSDIALDAAPPAPRADETPITSLQDPVFFALEGAPRSEEAIARALESRLNRNARSLGFTAEAPRFRADYVHLDGPSGYARLVQIVDGLEVEGTQALFSLRLLPGETRVVNSDVHLYPGIRAEGRTAPDENASLNRVAGRLPARLKSRRLSHRGAKVRWMKGRWRAVREFGLDAEGLRAAVDDAGNAVLWRDRLYTRDYQGSVQGRGVLFDPSVTGNNLVSLPMVDFAVGLPGAATVYSDPSGAFLAAAGPDAGGPFPLRLTGRWAKVNDAFHPNLSVPVSTGDVNPLSLTFNPAGNGEFDTAQVNAYYHVDAVHNWAVAHGANPTGINVPIPVNMSVVDPVVGEVCNAFYSPGVSTLNFFHSGGGCPNTAYDTVIYHEYGHFIDDMIGGIPNSALSEGWGDVVAVYMTGQAKLGEGFNGPGTTLRTADNNYVYNAADEAHTQGQSWSGFAWHLRQNLMASMGSTAGAAKAESLVIPVFWANSATIPAAVREVALRDDDDGNLSNGTPHFADILNAANRHGLSQLLDVVAPAVSIASPLPGAALTGLVTVSGTASDNNALSKVEVRVDGGAFSPAAGAAVWSFSLDSSLFANGSHTITARATDGGGNTASASVSVTFTNAPSPVAYDPVLKTAKCGAVGSFCASAALFTGRASILSGVEPNQPNTINNACADGTSGSFHSDESLDSLRVATLDGSNFAPGKTVSVQAGVWAFSGFSSDFLDLYSAANANSPAWTYLGTLKPTQAGSQVLSTTFTLPTGGLQALRGNFRYVGAAAPCTAGAYDDRDDLVFAVGSSGVDVSSPVISAVSAASVTASGASISWATDEPSDSQVEYGPTSSYGSSTTLNAASVTSHLQALSGLSSGTSYHFRVRSKDPSGNLGLSGDAVFSTPVPDAFPAVSISTPANNQTLSGVFNVQGTASDDVGVAKVEIRVGNGAYVLATGTASWSASLDTRPLSTHTFYALWARVTDTAGQQTSTTLGFFVQNPDPTAAIAFPEAYATGSGFLFASGSAWDDFGLSTVKVSIDANGPLIGTGTFSWSAAVNTVSYDDGLHYLNAQPVDLGGNVGGNVVRPFYIWNAGPVQGQASYDASLKVPACLQTGAACDSGVLLDSRGNYGGAPELNQPNTLFSSCPDNGGGVYRYHPSFERLRVTSLDGGFLTAGKTARVEATVWAEESPAPMLDLYIATDAFSANWVQVSTFTTALFGRQQVYATTITLPTGGLQALRGHLRSPFSSAAACSTAGDNDDLAFLVAPQAPPDAAPPVASITAPAFNAAVHDDVTLSAAATDNSGAVSQVVFEVRRSMPPFDLVFNSTVTVSPYQTIWPAGALGNGLYSIQATAYDPSGNAGSAFSQVNLANDVTSPVVALTTPTFNAVVHDDVALAATASDDFGVVSRVVFEVRRSNPPFDLVFNSTATAPPYQATWNAAPLSNGLYSIQALAYDPKGHVGSAFSQVNLVNDVTAPVVVLTTPTFNAVVHDDVPLAATASDDFGVVSQVVFEVRRSNPPFDVVFNSTATAPPYQATWNAAPLPNGLYSVQASAYDPKGHVGSAFSQVNLANDVTSPVVALTTPTFNAVVHDDVALAATATDDFGVVSRVVFEVRRSNPPFDVVFNSTGTAPPYQATWNAAPLPNGLYSIQALAYDPKGHVGSAFSQVNLANDVTAPVVVLTTPTFNAVVHDDVPLAATASDDFGVVSQVVFEVRRSNPPFDVVFNSTATAPPYQATWNAAPLPNGLYSIQALAYDPKGHVGSAFSQVNLANDVTSPVVALTTPAYNAVVHDDVALAATASDDFGVVSQVVFEVRRSNPPFDVVFNSTATAPPYQATWNAAPLPNGLYSIQASAYDPKGHVGSAFSQVNLANDVTAPVVSITTPTAGASLSGVVTLRAAATDDTGVALVQFKVDGIFLSSATAAPYQAAWNTSAVPAGTHTITVTAYDAKGNAGQASVQVSVDNRDLTPPLVAVTTPTAGAVLTGQVILTASSTDLGGPGSAAGVAGVKFRMDGSDLGTEDGSAPYSLSWNTTLVANGTHTLTAVSRDAAGNVRVSSGVLVTVQNFSVKVNFQPSASALPSGYVKDSGLAFGSRGNGFTYGWNAVNNNTRDRNSSLSLDQRYDTFIQMQTGGTFTWSISVPNGSYQVRLVAGDPTAINSAYRINVEGVLVVNGTPTSAARWVEGTAVVAVSDGRLTVANASGSSNNKLCFLEMSGVNPSGSLALASPSSVLVAGVPGADPLDEDPSRAKAKESFLSPSVQDGVNDAAVFGPAAEEVTVFDLRGETVFHGFQDAGGAVSWSCRDASGRMVESGVYIARLRLKGGGTAYQTLTIVK